MRFRSSSGLWVLPGPSGDSLPVSPPTPWYESNLIWAPVAIAAGLVIAVIAAMVKDVRWLLWVSAPLFVFGSWAAVRAIPSTLLRRTCVSFASGLICCSLWYLYSKLAPPREVVAAVPSLSVPPIPPPAAQKPHPANPPRQRQLRLIFKDSPLFTKARKDRIMNRMEDFYLYLKGIGLDELPKEIPPIGVGGNYGASLIYPGPIYLGTVTIPETAIDDPAAPVIVYGQYSFGYLMDVHNFNKSNQDRRQRASWIFEVYFVSSFLKKKPPDGASDIAVWGNFLWDVRRQYGQQFSDTATVFALKAFNDFGEEGGNQKLDLNTYLRNSFVAGESVADDNLKKMQGINDLLRKYKLIP
jgi:hypothetical protein